MRRFFFIVALSSSISFACTAVDPDTGSHTSPPDASTVQQEPGQVPLTVGAFRKEAPWKTVKVKGKGPIGGTVLITGGSSPSSTKVQADGTFCEDVPLAEGDNSLTMQATAKDGRTSKKITNKITRKGEIPKTGDKILGENVMHGGIVNYSTTSDAEGSYSNMADGDLKTFVNVEDSSVVRDWFILELPETKVVEKIRVISSKECKMGDYLVHTTNKVIDNSLDVPHNTNQTKGMWQFRGRAGLSQTKFQVKKCTTIDEDLICHEFNFPAQLISALGFRFETDDCTTILGVGQRDIYEIEAWSPDSVAKPGIGAPSCSSGGK